MPTGNYAADMAKVEAYYRSVTPRHPQRMMESIVASSDDAGDERLGAMA